ncbi:sulfite exporter TauE/SafE family protein [Pasteurellaceae bacterium LIM206]|nr:sulfite exporter TauE/SafE family protein [Pasteurellaceae bacterium LIM206]
MLTFFLISLIAGCVVGFLAGLFGIGGGLVVVPTLVYLLPIVGVPDSMLMSTALGTSFATIVITGFSSAHRHHKLGNIVWPAVKYLAPAIMVATFLSGLFIGKLPKDISSKIFAVLVVYLVVKMMISATQKTTAQSETGKPLTPRSSVLGGILIGIASSAAGIGGGGFIVPFLHSRGIEMKKAIGSSAFCGALLGISGMLSFIAAGWQAPGMPHWSIGYIYLPAVLSITATSFFTSKIGATTTTKLPVPMLKRYFAVFLICVAIKMILD